MQAFVPHQGWEVLGFTQLYFHAWDACRKHAELRWYQGRIPELEINGITYLEIGAADIVTCFGWALIRTRIEFLKILYPTQGDIWPHDRFSVKSQIFSFPDSLLGDEGDVSAADVYSGFAGTNTITDILSKWIIGVLVRPQIWWHKTLLIKREVNLALA